MEEMYYFGWVSSNVNSNFYAWSCDKGIGTEEEAEAFYAETCSQYEDKAGVEWFCYPAN